MGNLLSRFKLDGKVAIITGGAGLLGKKHAEAILEYGGIAILLDINDEQGFQVTQELSKHFPEKCFYYNCDITSENKLEEINKKIVNDFGKIDILINNAAIDPKVDNEKSGKSFSRLELFNIEQWNLELKVGLTGAFLCTKIFGYFMSQNGGGTIINISSDLGIIAPDQRLYRLEGIDEGKQPVKPVTYSVIKHGLIGLTKYIATYWADKGVRANALCPAGVFNNQPKEFVQKISNLIPMGRMANLEEYKGAIVFLASDASSYMNGATLIIDGGRCIW